MSEQEFRELATAEFSRLAKAMGTTVKEVVVCDAGKLAAILHLMIGSSVKDGECDIARATFENDMTIALAGSTHSQCLHFDVWTGKNNGHVKFTLPKFHGLSTTGKDMETSFKDWTLLEIMTGVRELDTRMRAIADALIKHAYMGQCGFLGTYYIRKPVAKSFGWE